MNLTYKQLSSLEDVIQQWISDNCENINVWWPEDSAKRMTLAAATIVDVIIVGQKAYEENNN